MSGKQERERGITPSQPEISAALSIIKANPDHFMSAIGLRMIYQLMNARTEAILRNYELTPGRYFALLQLVLHPEGEMPVGEMSDRVYAHPATMTNTINQMEQAGLVRRMPHASDGRSTIARITPAGRALALVCTTALEERQFGLEGLSPEHAGALREIVGQSWASLSDAEAGSKPRRRSSKRVAG